MIAQLCSDGIITHSPLRSDRTRDTDQSRVNRLCQFFGNRDARGLTQGDTVAFVPCDDTTEVENGVSKTQPSG